MKRRIGKWTTLAVILILMVNLMSPAFAADSSIDINAYRLGNDIEYSDSIHSKQCGEG